MDNTKSTAIIRGRNGHHRLKASPQNPGKSTRRRLKRGAFYSVVDLEAAINRFVEAHNKTPKPFVWRADLDDIIAARARGFQALESIH